MDWLSQVCSKVVFYLVLIGFECCLASTKVYTIESDKVCSPIKKRHIHIGRADSSAVIVKETRYFDTPLDLDFKCKFKVETAASMLGVTLYPIYADDGIFAVIQTLSLRQEMSTGECIDYIQFRPEGGSWSRQFCGQMSLESAVPAEKPTAGDVVALASNSVVDPRGKLDVLINVDKRKLQPGQKLDFSIAFTSFKDCRNRLNKEGYEVCLPEDVDGVDGSRGGKLCIWHSLFNDSVANCPYRGCPDEPRDFCPTIASSAEGGGNSMLVTVSAFASLVIAFAVFLSVLWVLRKLGRLCWAPCADRRRRDQPPPAPGLALEPLPPPPAEPLAPSAPTLDKDPPPTYDSLFP